MRVLMPMIRRSLFSPARIAVVDDQRAYRGYELYVAALHLAKKIEATTDRPNIGFMLPTGALSPIAFMAGWMLGRTIVPINYLLKDEDREFVIDDAELDCIITVKPMIEHFGELPANITQIRMDEMSFRGLPPLRRAKRMPDDHLAIILYTSGTSGRPKGVMLTSDNLASNV